MTSSSTRKGVDSPRLDAELLLSHALGLSRLELYTQHDRPLSEAERSTARELVERRGRREPLAYILGEWGFRRLTLKTDARALVPRPETEIVVERALALLDGVALPRVVDVGTGSGAIALAIAQERPEAHVTATDISSAALELALENADRLELAVAFVETSLLDGIEGPLDLVVSNPPYVDANEVDGLPPEVRDWEPRLALVGEGQTDALIRTAAALLAPGGALVLECHEDHARQVAAGLEEAGYAEVRITPDLAGRDRVVEGRWAPTQSQRVIEAIEAGEPVLVPTDTVYGLCASLEETSGRRLSALKGRDEAKPLAIIAASVECLFERIPELQGRSAAIVRALLPGPYTLILANPAGRYPWLNSSAPTTIGVRVAALPEPTQRVLDAVGAVVATSANEAGGRDPVTLDDVPASIRAACAAELDAGPLSGTPSTVIDFTGAEPVVLREGAASSAEAIARVARSAA